MYLFHKSVFGAVLAVAFGLISASAFAATSSLPANECESTVGTGSVSCYAAATSPCPLWTYSAATQSATAAVDPAFNANVPVDFPGAANSCYYAESGATPSPYLGARTQPGAGWAIDIWGACHIVTDNKNDSYFLPFKTQPEWNDFLSSASGGAMAGSVGVQNCTHSFLYQTTDSDVPGYTAPPPGFVPFDGDTGASQSPEQLCGHLADSHLPYWPTGQNLTRTITMQGCKGVCYTNSVTSDTQCGGSWDATVNLNFTALNSNDAAIQQSGKWWADTATANLPVTYPNCDPRPTSYSTGSCSVSCGGGTQPNYATDGCGKQVIVSTQPCNTQACPIDNGGTDNGMVSHGDMNSGSGTDRSGSVGSTSDSGSGSTGSTGGDSGGSGGE